MKLKLQNLTLTACVLVSPMALSDSSDGSGGAEGTNTQFMMGGERFQQEDGSGEESTPVVCKALSGAER